MKGEIIPESAVRFVRDFDASPEKIWAFLTESGRLPEWYGDGMIEPRERILHGLNRSERQNAAAPDAWPRSGNFTKPRLLGVEQREAGAIHIVIEADLDEIELVARVEQALMQ